MQGATREDLVGELKDLLIETIEENRRLRGGTEKRNAAKPPMKRTGRQPGAKVIESSVKRYKDSLSPKLIPRIR